MLFLDSAQSGSSTNSALEGVQSRVMHTLRQDPEMQGLLAKDGWDRKDREAYENILVETVAAEFREEPLFAEYRRNPGLKRQPRDITHLTQNDSYDCMPMALLKGIVITRTEGVLLREQPGQTPLHRHHDYYLVGGLVSQHDETRVARHAGLMSSATGNYIDGTMPEEAYFRSRYGTTFEDFVAGVPFISHDHSLGTHVGSTLRFSGGIAPPELAALRKAAYRRGDVEALQRHVHGTELRQDESAGFEAAEQMLAARKQAEDAIGAVSGEIVLSPAAAAPAGGRAWTPIAEIPTPGSTGR